MADKYFENVFKYNHSLYRNTDVQEKFCYDSNPKQKPEIKHP